MPVNLIELLNTGTKYGFKPGDKNPAPRNGDVFLDVLMAVISMADVTDTGEKNERYKLYDFTGQDTGFDRLKSIAKLLKTGLPLSDEGIATLSRPTQSYPLTNVDSGKNVFQIVLLQPGEMVVTEEIPLDVGESDQPSTPRENRERGLVQEAFAGFSQKQPAPTFAFRDVPVAEDKVRLGGFVRVSQAMVFVPDEISGKVSVGPGAEKNDGSGSGFVRAILPQPGEVGVGQGNSGIGGQLLDSSLQEGEMVPEGRQKGIEQNNFSNGMAGPVKIASSPGDMGHNPNVFQATAAQLATVIRSILVNPKLSEILTRYNVRLENATVQLHENQNESGFGNPARQGNEKVKLLEGGLMRIVPPRQANATGSGENALLLMKDVPVAEDKVRLGGVVRVSQAMVFVPDEISGKVSVGPGAEKNDGSGSGFVRAILPQPGEVGVGQGNSGIGGQLLDSSLQEGEMVPEGRQKGIEQNNFSNGMAGPVKIASSPGDMGHNPNVFQATAAQLATVIRSILVNRSHARTIIRLQLEPEHLGSVTIHLNFNKGRLNADFYTVTYAAKEALEASFPQLREILTQYNVRLENVTVQLHESQNESGFGNPARQGNEPQKKYYYLEQYDPSVPKVEEKGVDIYSINWLV